MNIYQIHGVQNLGWYNKEEVYKISEHLHAMVYSFAFCHKKPENDLYPHEVSDVFYVGQTGTEEGKHLFYDQKVRIDMGSHKSRKYGKYYSLPKLRMKAHYKQFEKEKENQEKKYKVFHEYFTPSLRQNEQVFCNVMVPISTKSSSIKSWLLMIEAMVIHCYEDKWETAPLCNLANHTGNSSRIEDSISNSIIVSNEQNNLNKFLIDEWT